MKKPQPKMTTKKKNTKQHCREKAAKTMGKASKATDIVSQSTHTHMHIHTYMDKRAHEAKPKPKPKSAPT